MIQKFLYKKLIEKKLLKMITVELFVNYISLYFSNNILTIQYTKNTIKFM